MAGRLGDIQSVRALRSNIKSFAGNSAEAKKAWVDDPTLEAWIIWNIWQVSNPNLADVVEVEPEFRIYRDTGIVLTNAGKAKPEAKPSLNTSLRPRGPPSSLSGAGRRPPKSDRDSSISVVTIRLGLTGGYVRAP
jgi:hypothetical protein